MCNKVACGAKLIRGCHSFIYTHIDIIFLCVCMAERHALEKVSGKEEGGMEGGGGRGGTCLPLHAILR
jgi:hypothetical protein